MLYITSLWLTHFITGNLYFLTPITQFPPQLHLQATTSLFICVIEVGAMLSEVSQTGKDKYHVISVICGINKQTKKQGLQRVGLNLVTT